jgi:hypothetical protein
MSASKRLGHAGRFISYGLTGLTLFVLFAGVPLARLASATTTSIEWDGTGLNSIPLGAGEHVIEVMLDVDSQGVLEISFSLHATGGITFTSLMPDGGGDFVCMAPPNLGLGVCSGGGGFLEENATATIVDSQTITSISAVGPPEAVLDNAEVLLFRVRVSVTSAGTVSADYSSGSEFILERNGIDITGSVVNIAANVVGVETRHGPLDAQLYWNHAVGGSSSTPTIPLFAPHGNDNTRAIVLLTRHAAPFGRVGFSNDVGVAVTWDSGLSRWEAANADGSSLPGSTAVNALVVPSSHPRVFIQTSTGANVSGKYTTIDHPLANGMPNALILATPNQTPFGTPASAISRPLGVWYDSLAGRWGIFDQGIAAMEMGESFNVAVIPAGEPVGYVHHADVGNTTGSRTTLDHFLLNGRPDALVFVTQNWNPPTPPSAVYNAEHVVVSYDTASERWRIGNENFLANMPIGAAFNVYSPVSESAIAQHRATAPTFNYTLLGESGMLGDGGQRLIVSPNLSPQDGLPTTSISKPYGVFYTAFSDAWAIFNQDNMTSWPVDTVHNVYSPEFTARSWTHQGRVGNVLSSLTILQHPLLDDRPEAVFVVTQNWNSVTSSGVYNDEEVRVVYDVTANRWWIGNADGSSMPLGAEFNILLPGPDDVAFQVTASGANTDGATMTIDHPSLNGLPHLTLLGQNNFSGFGAPPTDNLHSIASQYDDATGRWKIVNLDGASFAVGATVNVIAVPEPNRAILLLFGLLGFVMLSARKCTSTK